MEKQLTLDEQIRLYTEQLNDMFKKAGTADTPEPIPTPQRPNGGVAPSPAPIAVPPPAPPNAASPAQQYAQFVQDNPEFGTIRLQTLTARRTYPVPGVTVTVSKEFDSGEYIISTQTTDEAGQIAPITVPAPPRSLSEQPGSTVSPAAWYKVTMTHPEFATVISPRFPVFSGVSALQTIEMIPLSASPNGNKPIIYDVTEPSDL